MASIINGLFSGRSGIASHGVAIAVIGDNISNSSTLGYKKSRSEFEDIIAGGQTAGKTVGSGSAISKITNINEQGTLEYTGRTLDLAMDGEGFFVVDNNGSQTYTRAGNFTVDDSGFIVNQKGNRVQGFPNNGSGALEDLNINQISQSNVRTENIVIAGNLNAGADVLSAAEITASMPALADVSDGDTAYSYADLNGGADFSTVVSAFDSLGVNHTVTMFFHHTSQNEYTARGFVNSEEVDTGTPPVEGYPRMIFEKTLTFNSDGSLNAGSATPVTTNTLAWNNGATDTLTMDFDLQAFTQYASSSDITSITGDGDGIGSITSLSIDSGGDIFALLNNGQSSVIGTVGLVNFSNPEGLERIGGNAWQQTTTSGAPIIGKPGAGTFGSVQSGSLELSTVDIASEFVSLITLQRGFQASSRIITTIDQLLNEIMQLA